MSDNFQYGDLIFLGLIAVFVALRFRSMLGKSSGSDPLGGWKQAAREKPSPERVNVERMFIKKPTEEEIVPAGLAQNQPVATGLRAIRAADAGFSTTEFLAGAKLAFEWLVKAYSRGEKDKLKTLLSEERYAHFADDIDTRAISGQYPENTLVSVESADITEASLIKNRAQITVQFTTEQVHVVRDKDNNLLSGDPAATEKVIDVWTFERDVTSRDPNWKITHT